MLTKLNELSLFQNPLLFGEGGDGGAGAAPADGGAMDGEAGIVAEEPNEEHQAEAQETWETVRKRWEKEINKEKQDAVNRRLRGSKARDERLQQANDILRTIGTNKYGLALTDGEIDLAALQSAVKADNDLYAKKAEELGVSVETYRQFDDMRRERDQLAAEKAAQQQDLEQRAQFETMMRQTEEAKKSFPDLDIMAELERPEFARLIHAGVPVKTAYLVIHGENLIPQAMHLAAKDAASGVAKSVQANAKRPNEAGLGNKPASDSRIDPRKFTLKDFQNYMDRVRRGEKITF